MNQPPINNLNDSTQMERFIANGFLAVINGARIAWEESKNNENNENNEADEGIFDKVTDKFLDGIKRSVNKILEELNKNFTEEKVRDAIGRNSNAFKGLHETFGDFNNIWQHALLVNTGKAAGKGALYFGLGAFIPFFFIRYIYQYSIHRFKTPRIVIETSLSSGWYETFKWIFGIRPQASEDLLNNMIFSPEILEYIKEIVGFEKLHDQYQEGFDNLLFMGPPGTGKTMIAKALAKALGLEYAIFTGSTFFQENAGVKSLDQTFHDMTKGRKILIFIDEIDSLLAKRSELSPDSDGYKFLNHFLNYTSTPNKNFLLVGATNHPEILDDAVHRRFQHVIEMPLPNAECREKAFNLFKDTQFKDIKGIDINNILLDTLIHEMAQITIGCSYSDIQTIMDHIRLLVRSKDKKVSPAMILEITHRVKNKAGKFVKQY